MKYVSFTVGFPDDVQQDHIDDVIDAISGLAYVSAVEVKQP